MRTFIAVELDPSIKENLTDLLGKLQRAGGDVRWIRPRGMHLTLKFLGETSEEQAEEVKEGLDRACSDVPPFPLRLRGTGSFPPGKKNPRVLWVGVEENRTMHLLQERIEREMEKIGFPAEKRTFHPHLTLGRVKSPQRLEKAIAVLAEHAGSDFGSMTVDRVTFFRSILKPSGPEYSKLGEYTLG